MILRDARSTDAGKIGAILGDFVRRTPWIPCLHSGAEDIAHAGRMIDLGWVRVIEDNGNVLGFSANDGPELNALYVSEQVRRQGVGSMMMNALQAELPELRLWTFQANIAALAFYKKHGFQEVTRTNGSGNDEKLPDINLLWRRGTL